MTTPTHGGFEAGAFKVDDDGQPAGADGLDHFFEKQGVGRPALGTRRKADGGATALDAVAQRSRTRQ